MLTNLDTAALPRLWKKMHAVSGWWERHCSDGQDNLSRVHVRRAGEAWELLASRKTQQVRDLAWLARQP